MSIKGIATLPEHRHDNMLVFGQGTIQLKNLLRLFGFLGDVKKTTFR